MPVCARCERSGRWCDHSRPLKIRAQKNIACRTDNQRIVEERTPSPRFPEPQKALQDEEAAVHFEHYLKTLAQWYDLVDLDSAFARAIGERAQHSLLLLSAILAFEAIHKSRTGCSGSKSLADHYHAQCLRLLIGLDENDVAAKDGTALAATCLLRSYEILAGTVSRKWNNRILAKPEQKKVTPTATFLARIPSFQSCRLPFPAKPC